MTQTVEEQALESQRSSVIVAEHGSLAYGALYAQDGAVLVSIGSRLLMKDPHILFFATHFNVLWMPAEEPELLSSLLAFATKKAALNFGWQ